MTQKYLNDDERETLTSNVNYSQPKTVNLANGSTIKTNQILNNISTSVKNKSFPCSFVVFPKLSNSYDAILGMPHLEMADADISLVVKHSIGEIIPMQIIMLLLIQ